MDIDNQLKVATLPLDIAWADPTENLYSVDRMLEPIGHDFDIIVLPELFSTGFINSPEQLTNLAELNNGKTISQVKAWAEKYNAAFSGSYLAKDGDDFCNRCFFVEPSGETTFYDKHHLFSLSREGKFYKAGVKRPPIIRFRGWNISMIVCYDLRFPVWCRSYHNSYDILIVPANWGKARLYAWQHLLIARAIENQAIVIGANRSGVDDYGEYDGTSFIYDAMGHDITMHIDKSPVVYATVSKNKIEQYRHRMPSGQDGDKFEVLLSE
jgi:predicted amidohydrolase